MALSLFIVLFCNSCNINLEAIRATRATNFVLARLFGQSQYVFAIRTAAVNVRLAVANAVALKSEKCGYFLCKTKKIRVLLAPFIEILRQISVKRPGDERKIDRTDDQPRYARQKEIHNYKREAYDYQKIIKRVNAVSSLHKLPYALAKWSFVFHNKPPGNA